MARNYEEPAAYLMTEDYDEFGWTPVDQITDWRYWYEQQKQLYALRKLPLRRPHPHLRSVMQD